MSAHPAGSKLSLAEKALAERIARFQHANESLHRHPSGGETCDYCDLVGVYAVLTLRRFGAEALAALAEAGALESFGLIWRPKAGSRRWQHRMRREGRAYPATAEFVEVYRIAEASVPSTADWVADLLDVAARLRATDPTTATDALAQDALGLLIEAAAALRRDGRVITGEIPVVEPVRRLCPRSFADEPANHVDPAEAEGWGVCRTCGEVLNIQGERLPQHYASASTLEAEQ